MNQELQACQNQLDAAFAEMERARQYLKERSLVRFRDPFGSPERDTANYLYEEAERDFKAAADAFAVARKQFDDVRMHSTAPKGGFKNERVQNSRHGQ